VESGTQTEDDQVLEEQDVGLPRTRSLSRHRQLAQRPSREAQVTRRSDEAITPQNHPDRRGDLAVRLDMDLELEITMHAKIKGMIELSILDSGQVNQRRHERET
jgi:hypothetical protein